MEKKFFTYPTKPLGREGRWVSDVLSPSLYAGSSTRIHKTYQPQRTAAPERGAASRTRPGRAGLRHAEPGEVDRGDSDPRQGAEDPPRTGSVDCQVPGSRQTRPEPPAVQE